MRRYTWKDNLFTVAAGVLVGSALVIAKIKAAEPPRIPERHEHIVYYEPETEIILGHRENGNIQILETEDPETEEATEEQTEDATTYFDIPMSEAYQTEIFQIADRQNIDRKLLLGLIKTESDFIFNVTGDNGQAIGPCQIWPKWWSELAEEKNLNIYEPFENIELACEILNIYLEESNGDIEKALILYNGGQEYAARVFFNMEGIKEK